MKLMLIHKKFISKIKFVKIKGLYKNYILQNLDLYGIQCVVCFHSVSVLITTLRSVTFVVEQADIHVYVL